MINPLVVFPPTTNYHTPMGLSAMRSRVARRKVCPPWDMISHKPLITSWLPHSYDEVAMVSHIPTLSTNDMLPVAR